jgi:hypothetical protein
MKEEDRRKEYEYLRTKSRNADFSCQLIVATLSTITGAIIIKWNEHWYTGLTIQLIWLFGIMYFAERRFSITRIAGYIYNKIETDDTGFGYETFLKTINKRPLSLPSPLYREVSIGIIVSLFIPFITRLSSKQNHENLIFWVSLIFGIGITVLGIKQCMDYKKFKNQFDKKDPE